MANELFDHYFTGINSHGFCDVLVVGGPNNDKNTGWGWGASAVQQKKL